MRKKIPLIIGIVLALLAIALIKNYTDQQRQAIIKEANKRLEKIRAEQVPVLLAKKDMPKGTSIDQDSFEVAIASIQQVQPQAVSSLDRIAGMVTAIPISRGEQITLNKLILAKEVSTAGGSLAMVTPIGKRAIAISVDNISALGGMIRPGNYVDVVAMISVPVTTPEGKQVSQSAVVSIFQNVLVLAVGQETGAVSLAEGRYKKEEKKEISPLITLALTPQEANLLAFVQEQGKIRLSLRSPSDTKIEPLQPDNWDSLFQYLMPREIREEKQKPSEYIEIYRGLSKEKIPLSK